MKIVFLDAKSIGDDIDLSGFDQLGEVVKYGFSTPEEAGERTKDADVVIINKVQINEQTIGRADHLKLVCVTATGTNNLDKEYLAKRQIEWRNVAGYSTETVAQHTFALLFYLLEKLNYYDQYVKSEKYIGDTIFNIGVVAFVLVLAFHIITLPVEFNASSRALANIQELGLVDENEYQGAKRVLRAAAMTYVAATAVAAANLIRVLAIRGRRN